MAIVRINTADDATWARAWSVANSTEFTTLMNTFASPGGPKRGDMIFQIDTSTYYIVVGGGAGGAFAFHPISLVNDITGILGPANGGTGLSGYAGGDLIVGVGGGTLTKLAKDTNATRYLANTGTSNTPKWDQVNLADGVTGTLPVGNGGTGITSLTANRIPYGNGSSPFQSDADLTFDGSTLTLNGLADISGAAGGQIKFPATQNPSSNANTLDDYEEGTWTPTIGGSTSQSGQIYSAQSGLYTKIGNLVTFKYAVILSTLGTITGQVQVKGLPFTAADTVYTTIGWDALTTAYVNMSGFVLVSTTVIALRGITAAATSSLGTLAQADLSNTSGFFGSGAYFV